jgi:hypothetical protein
MTQVRDASETLLGLDPGTLEEYQQTWRISQGLTEEELSELAELELNLSVDLEEATYRIPFCVLDENVKLFDRVMANFLPYTLFRDIFTTHAREVDMTELVRKGLWEGPDKVTSARGSFMGDGLSFIHLTLMLQGITRMTCAELGISRPTGQSVGDDLFTIKSSFQFGTAFCYYAEKLGCKFSKLNSLSEDTITFCEQYCARVHDIESFRGLKSLEGSIFGDLVFLDTIKGSCLSKQAKVQATGTDPFFGHANMLTKQTSWHPSASVRRRSCLFLWADNFLTCKGLSSSMASLPQSLGGASIAIGNLITDDDPWWKDKRPYYEALLRLEDRDFLSYYLLLRGIYQANPKGFAWLNNFELIQSVVSNCCLYNDEALERLAPEWLHNKSTREKISYFSKELDMISFHSLNDCLARQDAFLQTWNLEKPTSRITMATRHVRIRANKAWAKIKTDLRPEGDLGLSIKAMDTSFRRKTWGLWVSRKDPAIVKAFDNLPRLDFEGRDGLFKVP